MRDELGPARGCIVGSLLGIALWGGIYLIVRAVMT